MLNKNLYYIKYNKMNTMFKLEDFLPYYPEYNSIDNIYSQVGGNVLNAKTEFSTLVPSKPSEKQEGYFTNQEIIGRFLSPITPYKRLLVFHGPGSGKCHAYNTPILMYSGQIKMIQDITVGDMVMGDDSNPRTVLNLARGIDNMYTIKQSWSGKYTVNSEHILCLKCIPCKLHNETWYINPKTLELEKYTNQDYINTVYEIPVNLFITLPTTVRSMLRGYTQKIEFQEQSITDDKIEEIAKNIELSLNTSEVCNENILNCILYNSCHVREKFLNMLFKLCGYQSSTTKLSYILIEKFRDNVKHLIKQLVFLIRSLGYSCKYIKTKETIVFDTCTNLSEISVKWDRHDNYYGFSCDSNHRYLLGDCTVTHNSCVIAAVTEIAKKEIPTSDYTTLILVKTDSLKDNMYRELLEKCPTKDVYSRPTFEEGKKIIKSSYRIETFTDFNKELREKLSNMNNIEVIESLQEEFKNKYIIIDEAHNLYPENKNPEKYKNIQKLFMLLQDTKIALLTATPMKNDIEEIVYLMNLVVPLDKKIYPKQLDEAITTLDPEKLNYLKLNYFAGHVSYYRTLTSVITENIGNVSPENGIKFTKIVQINMGKIQHTAYKEKYWAQEKGSIENASEKDIFNDKIDDKGSGLGQKSTLSSCSVFPDGNIRDDSNHWVKPKENVLTENFEKWLRRGYITGGKDMLHKVYIQNLELISSKYSYILKTILNSTLEKHYVYCVPIENVGLNFLSALLKFFGYQEFKLPSNIEIIQNAGLTLEDKQKIFEEKYGITKGQRFILITGSMTADKLRPTLEIFNDPANIYGEYISVIMGGKRIQEGFSFFEIRNIFIVTPEWNNATLEQAIGRGIRAGSHDRLEPEQRIVKIYRLWSKPLDSTYSIDIKRYSYSENKNIRIKRVERLIKESAIDCEINKSRNIQPSDKPYSIQCDYLEHCNYNCVFDTKLSESINDTYNLYYSSKSEKEILYSIHYIYTLKSSYTFNEMYSMLQSIVEKPINNIILAKTLYDIISNNIKIYNKYGFINYLREESNVYFLVDDPKAGTQYELCYYAKNPYPTNVLLDISQSVEEYLYTKTHKYITWFFESKEPLLYINIGDTIFKMFFYNMIKGALGDPRTKDKMIEYFKLHKDIEKEYTNIDNSLKSHTDTTEEIQEDKVSPEEIINYSLIWGFRGKLESKDGKLKMKIRDTSIIGFKKSDNELNSSTIRDGIVCGTGEFNFKGLCKTVLQLFIVSVITYQDLPMLEYIMDNFIPIESTSRDIIFNTLGVVNALDILKKEILIQSLKNISLIALKGIASDLTDKNDTEPERNATIRNIVRYTDKENKSVMSALRVLRTRQLEFINSNLK
jgi:superfamily II DNA or RNA helicase